MARFQVISDIHLAHRDQVWWSLDTFITPDPTVDGLLLAGDIGAPDSSAYQRLLEQASALFTNVYIVEGNHAYYGYEMPETERLMEVMCARYANVHYLQCRSVDIPGHPDIRLAGCTLWTDVPTTSAPTVQAYLSDYRVIYSNYKERVRISVEELNTVHRQHVAWLESEIRRATHNNKTLVVMTHHLPSTKLIHPKYTGSRVLDQLNTAFATNLERLMGGPVHTWVAGHTHTPARQVINGTDVVVNPVGYPHEANVSNRSLIITVAGGGAGHTLHQQQLDCSA
jgi:predicted phosphodiesterase